MDGHDRLRPGRDPLHDVGRVEVQRRRVDVREHRRRTAANDRFGRRVEREGRADDLVTGPDPHRVEDEHQRVRPVRDADRLRNAEVAGGLVLERIHVRAEDELPRLEDALELVEQLGDQRRVLRADVNQRDRGHAGQV